MQISFKNKQKNQVGRSFLAKTGDLKLGSFSTSLLLTSAEQTPVTTKFHLIY